MLITRFSLNGVSRFSSLSAHEIPVLAAKPVLINWVLVSRTLSALESILAKAVFPSFQPVSGSFGAILDPLLKSTRSSVVGVVTPQQGERARRLLCEPPGLFPSGPTTVTTNNM